MRYNNKKVDWKHPSAHSHTGDTAEDGITASTFINASSVAAPSAVRRFRSESEGVFLPDNIYSPTDLDFKTVFKLLTR